MVSSGVVTLVIAALAQAVYGAPSCGCGCGPALSPPVFAAPPPVFAAPPPVFAAPPPVFAAPPPLFAAPAPLCAAPAPALEEGCCPGPVVEKKSVITKSLTVPYSYTEPTFSKQCFQRPAGVDRKVIPSAFESAPVCETLETVVKVPTTDVQVQEQPLVRKTCTTSEYIIQIPIVETTCTSAPLCKKTVRTQGNVLTTVSKKTSCAKQLCTQNKVVEQPFTETVCQNYQGSVTKAGAQTVLKPEVVKSCVQLPPRKCLKPATGPGVFLDYGNGPVPYGGDAAFAAAPAPFLAEALPFAAAPAPFLAEAFAAAPAPYLAEAFAAAPAPYLAEAFAPAPAPYLPEAFLGAPAPLLADAFAPAFYGTGPYFAGAVVPSAPSPLPTAYLGPAPGPVCSCVG